MIVFMTSEKREAYRFVNEGCPDEPSWHYCVEDKRGRRIAWAQAEKVSSHYVLSRSSFSVPFPEIFDVVHSAADADRIINEEVRKLVGLEERTEINLPVLG